MHARTKKYIYADIASIVACAGVILLHVSLDVYTPHVAAHWLHSLALQALAIFSVPVFFMLSGIKSLDYPRRLSTRDFLVRRLSKVCAALLVGSLVCYIVYGIAPAAFWDAEKLGISFSPLNFLKLVFANGINDTYWFLYTTIGLYLLTPVLSLAVADDATEGYLLLGCLAIAIGFPLVNRLFAGHAHISDLFSWPLFSSEAVLYYVGGHWLVRHKKDLPQKPLVWAGVFVISTLCIFVISALKTGAFSDSLSENYDSYYASIISPAALVQSVSMLMLLVSLEPRFSELSVQTSKAISFVASLTLPIYLIHTPITNWVSKGAPQAFGAFLNNHKIIEALFVAAFSIVLALVWDLLLRTVHRAVDHKAMKDR